MASKNKDYGSIESLKRKRARMYARCVGGGILIGLGYTPLILWQADGTECSFYNVFFTLFSFCMLFAGIGYLIYITTRGLLPSQRFLTREMRDTDDELDISDYAGTSKITKTLGILSIAALVVFIVGIGVLQREEIIETVMGAKPNWAHLTFTLGLGTTSLGLHQLLVVFRIRKPGIYEPEDDEIFVQLTRLITIVFSVFGFLTSLVYGRIFKSVVPIPVHALISGLVAGILVMAGPTVLIIEIERMRKEETLSLRQGITLGVVVPIIILLAALYILYKSAV